jgi:c-di-GMP-binding flagellar brake protein YcgR
MELAIFARDNDRAAVLEEGTKVSVDIRINGDNGDTEILSLPSTVEEVASGSFLLQMPMYKGSYYPIPRDEMLLIYFAVYAGYEKPPEVYMLPARFVRRVTRNSAVYASMEPLGKIERSQRRDCYRLPLSRDVLLRRNLEVDEMPVHARMMNFSDGGMLLAADMLFEKNERVTLEFNIGSSEIAEGTVLRAERAVSGGWQFHIAVRFENVSAEQKERFYRYILSKQLEKRPSIRNAAFRFT